MGDYSNWSEDKKQKFLLEEIVGNRPLIGSDLVLTSESLEVVKTFELIAKQPQEALGAYVISMAKRPSDILVVQLLLKEMGCKGHLPVVPLFETLDDLNNANGSIEILLKNKSYKKLINGELMVMIGYSDSAKDAGR